MLSTILPIFNNEINLHFMYIKFKIFNDKIRNYSPHFPFLKITSIYTLLRSYNSALCPIPPLS